MKKVFLLVAIFLGGMATQAKASNAENVSIDPGTRLRSNASQEIKFMEDGVLYAIATDGTFRFQFLRSQHNYRGLNHQVNYYNNGNRPQRGNRIRYAEGRRAQITTDRFGNVRTIGNTYITYKRNGKVKSIGNIQLRYDRGRLLRVGKMDIIYNRRGHIVDTRGYVNKRNRNNWHNDWYYSNNVHQGQVNGNYIVADNWQRSRRERKSK